jgi:hypothetical protein
MNVNNNLSTSDKWAVYRALVVLALVEAGYNKDHFELADSLDMSFEEIENLPYDEWHQYIMKDLQEMIADCPEDFS